MIKTAVTTPLMFHQEAAVNFVMDKKQAYLALDMGLGKTACAIEVINRAKALGETPALVVVPPSLRLTWVKELEKFAPHLDVEILRGSYPRELRLADVYIIGDSVIASWTPDLKDDPLSLLGKFKTLIVDESHRVKNISARRTQAVIKISKTITGFKLLMSGTPTPNGRNMEMGSQIEILGDEAWKAIGGKGVFWNYYCPVELDENGKRNKWGKRANIDSLGLNAALTSSFMLRLKRDDVLDLPNKGRAGVHVEGKGQPVKDYLLAEEDLIAYLAGAGKEWRGAMRNEALVKLTTMRKLAGACKVKGVVERAKELFKETLPDGHGLFIVAEHHDVMNSLTEELSKYGVVGFNGGMDDNMKAEAVRAFNSGEARVMIGQIKSVGVGLTLHGDGRNHHVLITQLPWSPSDLTQVEDRLHRIGQTNDVNVEVCLASIDGSWTIDERLWGLLESKAFSAGEIIDGKGEYLLEEIQDSLINSYR